VPASTFTDCRCRLRVQTFGKSSAAAACPSSPEVELRSASRGIVSSPTPRPPGRCRPPRVSSLQYEPRIVALVGHADGARRAGRPRRSSASTPPPPRRRSAHAPRLHLQRRAPATSPISMLPPRRPQSVRATSDTRTSPLATRTRTAHPAHLDAPAAMQALGRRPGTSATVRSPPRVSRSAPATRAPRPARAVLQVHGQLPRHAHLQLEPRPPIRLRAPARRARAARSRAQNPAPLPGRSPACGRVGPENGSRTSTDHSVARLADHEGWRREASAPPK